MPGFCSSLAQLSGARILWPRRHHGATIANRPAGSLMARSSLPGRLPHARGRGPGQLSPWTGTSGPAAFLRQGVVSYSCESSGRRPAPAASATGGATPGPTALPRPPDPGTPGRSSHPSRLLPAAPASRRRADASHPRTAACPSRPVGPKPIWQCRLTHRARMHAENRRPARLAAGPTLHSDGDVGQGPPRSMGDGSSYYTPCEDRQPGVEGQTWGEARLRIGKLKAMSSLPLRCTRDRSSCLL